MKFYTNHGEQQAVPNLIGMDLIEAQELIASQGLRIEAEDSSYFEGATPGSILTQSPDHEYLSPDSAGMTQRMVKSNRKIYVSIASYLPPKVEMPDMVGKSKRIALDLLKTTGFRIEGLEYVPDRVCTDCVIKQLYKGKEIEPGTKIYKGESITLILGRKDASYVSTPKLSGYTYEEAKNILNRLSLNMGEVLGGCEGCKNELDTLSAYVLKQYPELGGSLNTGEQVDVYLTQDASLIK